jgi:hypothetical protein
MLTIHSQPCLPPPNSKATISLQRFKELVVAQFCLFIFRYGLIPVLLGGFACLNLQALEVSDLPASKVDMLRDPELYVDEVLDDMLGEDPSVVSLEKELGLNHDPAAPQHGFSIVIAAGGKKNILAKKSPLLDSRQGYYYADYYYANGAQGDDNILFLVYFENRTYPDIDVAGDVQTFAVSFAAENWLSKASMVETALDYAALVTLDSANAEENQTIDTIRSDHYALGLSWQYEIGNKIYTLLGLDWEHRYSEELVDRYYQAGVSAGLKNEYGSGSETLLTLTYDHSIYPEDTVTDIDGSFYEGEILENESRSITLKNDHFWPGDTEINLYTSLSYTAHNDNGPGYDKYDKYTLAERLQLTTTRWIFSENLDITYIHYKERTIEIPSGDTENLTNFEIEFGVSMERAFGNEFSVKAELETTKVESNDSDDQYEGNSFMLSSNWYF